jgi:hypothetical protein
MFLNHVQLCNSGSKTAKYIEQEGVRPELGEAV